jgi:DNA mismatch repair ATPase MutS
MNRVASSNPLGAAPSFFPPPSLAKRARIPRVPVMASIRGEHSIESGKSRYFAEMEALLEFLRCVERGDSPVLAVDEPFSGTNTVGRIAAAKAVLAALARRSQVLASTHDSADALATAGELGRNQLMAKN